MYKTYAVVREFNNNTGWVQSCEKEYIRTENYEEAKSIYDKVSIGDDGIKSATALLGSEVEDDPNDDFQNFDWQFVMTTESR